MEGVCSQLCVLLLVSEGADSSLDGIDEILAGVALEAETTASIVVPVEFNDRVFESSSLEGDDGCASDEELVLDNATRLEQTRHQTKVCAPVHKSTICEELLWRCPERTWVLLLEEPHLVGAAG